MAGKGIRSIKVPWGTHRTSTSPYVSCLKRAVRREQTELRLPRGSHVSLCPANESEIGNRFWWEDFFRARKWPISLHLNALRGRKRVIQELLGLWRIYRHSYYLSSNQYFSFSEWHSSFLDDISTLLLPLQFISISDQSNILQSKAYNIPLKIFNCVQKIIKTF